MIEIAIGEWKLRPWLFTDVKALARHANNREIWLNLNEGFPHPYTLDDAKDFISSQRKVEPVVNFAVASDHEAFGGIGLRLGTDVARKSAEVGYWLGEAYWGRGIATAALRAVVDYAFATFDLARIHAGVFEWNPASRRVLEKAGFSFEARLRKAVFKDERIIDQLLYALVR